MVTLAPLTTRPLAAVFVLQPTVPLLPWSARHSHRSSPTTLALLTTRVWVALPTVAPPMRANTSDRTVGSLAWLVLEPAGPICTSSLELVVPASKMNPPMRMPLTSAVDRIVLPPLETRVARPRPSTTVSGLLTWMVPLIWYTPGVNSRSFPAARAALIWLTVLLGVAR